MSYRQFYAVSTAHVANLLAVSHSRYMEDIRGLVKLESFKRQSIHNSTSTDKIYRSLKFTHITKVHPIGCLPHLRDTEPLFHLPSTTPTSFFLRRFYWSGQCLMQSSQIHELYSQNNPNSNLSWHTLSNLNISICSQRRKLEGMGTRSNNDRK